ncbi:hypothetical protein BASA60_001253 [Batrachochytrium salamandrivorans]|nr:hypothetical protein BASA62_000025 [Batrachochytrium salamandrivorans]KAH6583805.1 hypothetical protein BASA60_001253 [Batrachochytrium salamandrivorans]KAH9246616.1 hypothetical protein BASA81_015832 [Batrachochytrium salamandrivorans]
MLSRLIVTFLCAVAIGSVSGAFLTFEPARIVFKDTEISTSFSIKLKSKPTESVTVYLEHPSIFISDCVVIFGPDNWDIAQQIIVAPTYLPPWTRRAEQPLYIDSELVARAVTAGPLPPDLSSKDKLKVRQSPRYVYKCSVSNGRGNTFEDIPFIFNKVGQYNMVSTRDINIQVNASVYAGDLPLTTNVRLRYGSTIMEMDTYGLDENFSGCSVKQVTPNVDGMSYSYNPQTSKCVISFPCGSSLNIMMTRFDGFVGLYMGLLLVDRYPSVRGLCNVQRRPSSSDVLVGSNGKSYSRHNAKGVVAFSDSWMIGAVKDLIDPNAKALIPTIRRRVTVCTIPKDPQPNPVIPAPPLLSSSTTTATTTTATTTITTITATAAAAVTTATTTAATTTTSTTTVTTTTTSTTTTSTSTSSSTTGSSTTALFSTVNFSTSTSQYSASTLPFTTSTTTPSTSTISPAPPAPDGYIPPPPPPPPPDVVVEIQKCCQSIFNIPSCNAIVPTESYIQSCISDAQTSGSYVLSDKVKQEYLAKCRTLTDDMIRDPTKEVIDQGNQIRKEYGFGNGTCINSCSGKGTCTDFGCACSPGFSGMDCSMDLTKATQYDQSVDQYRSNANVTVAQQQTEPTYKLPGSDPSDPSDPFAPSVLSVHFTPSVDQSLASFVGSLPKPSTVSPHTAEESQPSYQKPYDDFQKPILSSAISFGSLHMVSVVAVVITSYILLL